MKNGDKDTLSQVLLGVISAKFGPGALGRIGTIAITAFVVLTLIAGIFTFSNPTYSLAIMAVVAALAFYVVHRAFDYAEKHPELSAMTGTEITKFRAQQASMRQLEGLSPPPPHVNETIRNPLLRSGESE